MKRHLHQRRGFGKTGLFVGLTISALFLALAFWPGSGSRRPRELEVANASSNSSSSFKAIEELRVGDRVLTGLASDSLCETSVDERTWKKVKIKAVGVWPDGTIDTYRIETLQPPLWFIANDARIGAEVPLPLDLMEMGCPEHLRGRVESIEPCPSISTKPGRVVLTTVNHLNNACRELKLRDSEGKIDIVKTTDWHPFWSETKQDWVKAVYLQAGDQLQGRNGEALTLVGSERIDGVHTVFNMTVEREHIYRVGILACLVHNQKCYRVVSDAELPSAQDGTWHDGPWTGREEAGKKWVWETQEEAERWQDFIVKNNEPPGSIVEIPIDNPITSYPNFPHRDPVGRAALVPISDLGKGIVVK